jgi:hypothetical protein
VVMSGLLEAFGSAAEESSSAGRLRLPNPSVVAYFMRAAVSDSGSSGRT